MTETELVGLIHSVAFGAFWILLFVAGLSTIARVAFYRVNRYKQPVLLKRDALLIGGFSISFGLILFARFAREAGFDISGLATSIWWALATDVPAIVAVATYFYYEVFVIERRASRRGDQLRDETYLEPPLGRSEQEVFRRDQ